MTVVGNIETVEVAQTKEPLGRARHLPRLRVQAQGELEVSSGMVVSVFRPPESYQVQLVATLAS